MYGNIRKSGIATHTSENVNKISYHFHSQLIISLAIGSVIDALETSAVIVYSASIFSFLAAISATQILYLDG